MRQLLTSISFLLLFVALEGCLPSGSGSITSENPPEGYIDILPGESLTLSVQTADHPEDTVKWYIDGALVAQGHSYVFELPSVYAKNTYKLEAKASSSPSLASSWTMRVKGRLWFHINHLALSVVDVQATLALYVDLFGYLPNGGTGNYGGLQGDIAGTLQGFDGSVESVSLWANDRNPKFQMEFTEYSTPQARQYKNLVGIAGVEPILKLANAYLKKGDFEHALLLVEIALEAEPDNHNVRKTQAAILIALRDRPRNTYNNFSEIAWLEMEIDKANDVLD